LDEKMVGAVCEGCDSDREGRREQGILPSCTMSDGGQWQGER